jgi:hypothetical protein
MRKALVSLSTVFSVVGLACAAAAQTQDSRPFEDVKPDNWAYQAVTDLQMKGLIAGYPEGYFNGQRTLTRYEFAVALKRYLDSVPGDSAPDKAMPGSMTLKGATASAMPSGPSLVAVEELDALKRLAIDFKNELISLGMNSKAVQAKLDRIERASSAASSSLKLNTGFQPGARSGVLNYGIGARIRGSSLLDDVSTPHDYLLEARTRLGGTFPITGNLSGSFLNRRASNLSVSSSISASRTTPPAYFDSGFAGPIRLFGGSTSIAVGRYGLTPELGSLDPGSSAIAGQVFGIHGGVPLARNSELGVTVLDFAASGDGINASGLSLRGAPAGNVAVYGANVRLNPYGRFAFSGEAAKSVTQHGFDLGDDSDENNAFLLNLGYNSGALKATAGYQYYDPQYAAPGTWAKIGGWYNPTNVQGPFTRLGYRFSDRANANVGVDYLTAARNRPGFGGFTQGSSVVRGLASMKYHLSKQFELTADYEGVLYDMSGAISASGLRARPVEQYITFGAGLNLTGNAVLRLAYQIINIQDASNGFGLSSSGGTSSGGSSTSSSVFTTQFSVHF